MTGFIITCPQCNHQFEPGDSMREEIQKELRGQMTDWQKKKDEEFRQKENAFVQQIKQKEKEFAAQAELEKKKIREELQDTIRKTLVADFENQVQMLQQHVADNEEKLKDARKKELEFLQKEHALKTKEEELELSIQRTLMEEREKMKEQLLKEEHDRGALKEQQHLFQVRQLEKQLEDQKKLAEEMRRKAEQGSTQLQGEVLELALEELLKTEFANDDIREVKKGEEGGDIVQTVCNEMRRECGIIVWETKRAKHWSDKWVDKLKEDTQKGRADIAVLVTQAVPRDIERFGRRDGIWICNFQDVKIIAAFLRDSLIRHAETIQVLDNVSDKKETLYRYMTSNEFKQKWEAIVGTYMNMQKQITKEKIRVTKEWAEREKQLEIMLKNSMGFIGDVKAIGGLEMTELNLLEDGGDE